ncbi:adenylosuccinate synthase [Gemmatimonadota bacterium]
MFGPHCRCLVVVGAQWGDEGKGKIVDVLSDVADIVVRYQGGANAGHTVVLGDEEFVLHQVPTGVLQPDTRCMIGNGVVLDPETFVAEVESLEARGIELAGRLAVSDRTHLVLPYHKLLDQAAESRQKIGTTRRGIGPAYEDRTGRRGIRVGDLRTPERVEHQLIINVERVNMLLEALGSDDRADVSEHMSLIARVAPKLIPLTADVGQLIDDALKAGKNLLLEGAQGALLDVDHGTFPFVTSSNTTAGAAAVGAGVGPCAIDVVLGVVKAYTTRVGNGPFPTEKDDEAGEALRKMGGEYGATTGRPRRCGWFDAVVGRYASRVNGFTNLAVTKLDVLDTLPTIPVCVGYHYRGERLDVFPADLDQVNQVEPIYEELDGWCQPTSGVRSFSDLPTKARTYVDRLEALMEVPVSFISVGTRRDQLIRVE